MSLAEKMNLIVYHYYISFLLYIEAAKKIIINILIANLDHIGLNKMLS